MWWKVGIKESLDDVPCCFGRSTEEQWGFCTSHLQTVWDHDTCFIQRRSWVFVWDGITKIPRILIVHDDAPEAILYIHFRKPKVFFGVLGCGQCCYDALKCFSKLIHCLVWYLGNGLLIDGGALAICWLHCAQAKGKVQDSTGFSTLVQNHRYGGEFEFRWDFFF